MGREGILDVTSAEERVSGGHELEGVRGVSFAIAYRMLGSVAEAEDVVQEALLRVHRAIAAGEQVASLPAFVSTVTTRLAINELRSARRRREQYVGEWLPAPVLADQVADPAGRAEMADSLSMALLVVLETLSPEQRAAWLLHDVFAYPFAEIATILARTEHSVRQLASRARRHIEDRRPRVAATAQQREELTEKFLAAVRDGDLAGLEALLADDVVLTGDGGGKVPALARSVHGRHHVARLLCVWAGVLDGLPAASLRAVAVNGGPGVLVVDDQERLLSVWALDIAGSEITAIRSVVNPDKLAHLGPLADFGALVASYRDARRAKTTSRRPDDEWPPDR